MTKQKLLDIWLKRDALIRKQWWYVPPKLDLLSWVYWQKTNADKQREKND